MEEVKYSVYVHINPLDNFKAYVGISKNPKKRWKNGKGYLSQPKFYYAIKKYGWKNFKHVILLENLSLEEARKKEKEYIKKYNSINEGYNIHEGGQIVMTPEMKKKGYVKKIFKNTQVFINYLKTGQTITYESVTEAALKTGITEYWFYMYYKKEVPMLEGIDIRFGIEYDKTCPTMSSLGLI